jgi:hypothetical protein
MSAEHGKLRYRHPHGLVVEREDGSTLAIIDFERHESPQIRMDVGHDTAFDGLRAISVPHRIAVVTVEFEQALIPDRGYVDGDAVEDEARELPGRRPELPRGED